MRKLTMLRGRTSDSRQRGRGSDSHRSAVEHTRTPASVSKQYKLVLVEGRSGSDDSIQKRRLQSIWYSNIANGKCMQILGGLKTLVWPEKMLSFSCVERVRK